MNTSKSNFYKNFLLDFKVNFKGLKSVIEEIQFIINFLILNKIFLNSRSNELNFHIAFAGPSGTGKTYTAKKFAQIFYQLGYFSKPNLLIVSREDLIGQYVGHTAIKTQGILEKAQGGILFIEDASELCQINNEQDFGKETIELLLQEMENPKHKILIIFADETEKLRILFDSNPGIASRIAHFFKFQDYSIKELINIFPNLFKQYSYISVDYLTKEIKFFENILKKKIKNFKRINQLEQLIYRFLFFQNKNIYFNTLIHRRVIKAKDILSINLIFLMGVYL